MVTFDYHSTRYLFYADSILLLIYNVRFNRGRCLGFLYKISLRFSVHAGDDIFFLWFLATSLLTHPYDASLLLERVMTDNLP
jgi:hypothetical protein